MKKSEFDKSPSQVSELTKSYFLFHRRGKKFWFLVFQMLRVGVKGWVSSYYRVGLSIFADEDIFLSKVNKDIIYNI